MSGYFAHFRQHKHYYISQAPCQAFISSIITIFTKTLVACYFRQNNLAWLIAFLNTNDPFVKFHALGKTILEDATLTWPKMPITL